jgi:alkanesulfonate monooxygenase SsuD/methylene tetrahydromethanopterin reductase-like flavin-dependent oxidoreductase (luciferase family)
MFRDEDLRIRVEAISDRDRNPLEHMVHQCYSKNAWFVNMLGIDIGLATFPKQETRLAFIQHYAEVTRPRFDAQNGPRGAFLVGGPEEVAEKILSRSQALGGISGQHFRWMSVAYRMSS